MEVSLQQDVLFLGGGVDDAGGVAKLAAVSFGPETATIVESEIGEDLCCIYSVKRLKEGNLLFAGGFGGVAVVFFEDNKFVQLCSVSDILEDEISDLKFFEGSLYCVSPANEEIAIVNFPAYRYKLKATPRNRAPTSLSTMFDLHIKKDWPLEGKANSNFKIKLKL
jgi:hypothetical protein